MNENYIVEIKAELGNIKAEVRSVKTEFNRKFGIRLFLWILAPLLIGLAAGLVCRGCLCLGSLTWQHVALFFIFTAGAVISLALILRFTSNQTD
jgi:hypothetical protein